MSKSLVVCMMLGLSSSALAAETVKIGFHRLRPHSYPEEGTGKATGSAVRLTEELLADAGYKVEWVGPLPFPRLLQMLKEGAIDGALPLSMKPEREAFAYCTEKPLFTTAPSFTVLETNPLTAIRSIADVKGYRVGFLTGADQSGFVQDNASSLTIETVAGENWIIQNLNKLIAGRLDAIYDLNPWSVPYEAKLAGLADKVKVLRVPGPPGANYVLVAKKSPKGQELYRKLNASLNGKKYDYQEYVDRVTR